MDNQRIFRKLEDLQRLCDEKEEESLVLEFKPCNELRTNPGRSRDNVLEELTKDVSAFLNAAGGTIIYGILEESSRAKAIDKDSAFKLDEGLKPEKITQWLRSHIQPPPTVNVYSVSEDLDNAQSPWYLVVEIPQGEQAYMAKDHRFYKRIANTRQPMEQYEVVDVMNRTRAAALVLQMRISDPVQPSRGQERDTRYLRIGITSTNFIASEYGALRLTLAYPIVFHRDVGVVFRGSHLESGGFVPEGLDYLVSAESMMMRWGANTGNVIFPGHWFDFNGNAISIIVPSLSVLPNPTYLVQAELFTMNSSSKKGLYSIRQKASSDDMETSEVDASNHDSVLAAFQETCYYAQERLQSS